VAISGEINLFDVGLAFVAGLYADVVNSVGGINGQVVFIPLATVGADDAAILPFGGAQGTDQAALGAVALSA
jgi:hypothetical protein